MDTGFDADELLTIDVGAEVRKLARAQLQGPWAIPAELIRTALRLNARSVDVALRRHSVAVRHDGAGLDHATLQALACLLDEHIPDTQRHRALVQLEQAGHLALLALAGLQHPTVTIQVGEQTLLQSRPGQRPRLTRAPATGPVRIAVECHEIEAKRAKAWLGAAVRFAPADIRVEGQRVGTGFQHAIASTSLAPICQGTLTLPRDGETSVVWLLEHGVVTTQLAVPGSVCFEAAIELGNHDTSGDAARLRELASALLPRLRTSALRLLVRAAGDVDPDDEAIRSRLAALVLRSLRQRQCVRELLSVPVFRASWPDAPGPRPVNLVTLRSWARPTASGRLVLPALYPRSRRRPGANPVAVLDEGERSAIAELLGLRFRPPDAPLARSGLLASLHRAQRTVIQGSKLLWDLMLHPGSRGPIDEQELEPIERQLLAHLRAQVPDPEIVIHMCSGHGPIRRRSGRSPGVWLPRNNPEVSRCVTAVARDPRWVYPASYLLLERYARPSEALRGRWQGRTDAE